MLRLMVVGALVPVPGVVGVGVGMVAVGVGMSVGRGCHTEGLTDNCFDVVSQCRCARLCEVNTIICKGSDNFVVDIDNVLVVVYITQ